MGQCKSIQRDLSFDLSRPVLKSQFVPLQRFSKEDGGDVVLFMDRDARQKVVGRVARRDHHDDLVDLCLEVEIMSELSHQHVGIVNLRSVLLTDRELVMFTQYMQGANLREYMQQHEVTEETSIYFLHQILSIVHFCHEHNVLQRDLKLESFICDEHHPPRLQLCDLGMSKQWVKMVTESKTGRARVGGMTPQMLENMFLEVEHEHDGEKVDVWAVGVCLCCLLFGSAAQDELHRATLNLSRCSWRTATSVKGQTERVSPEALDLLDRMLDPDERTRISVQGIMSHPWYNRSLPTHLQAALDTLAADQASLSASMSPRQSIHEATLHLTAAAMSGKRAPNGCWRLNYPAA